MSASRPGGWGRALRVCARWALAGAAVWALPSLGSDGGQLKDEWAPPPGSQPAPRQDAKLGDEDREVVQNLELLENLEASQDLDLLLELSKKDDDGQQQ